MNETPKAPACTTLYNGSCPVCRVEIDHYRSQDARQNLGLGWVDIGRTPAAAEALGFDPDAVRKRLHVLDAEGKVHIGIDGFLLLWSHLPRYRWLGRLVAKPWLKPLAVALYDRVLAPLLFAWDRRRRKI
jgi:predicted DCC family thiol-disulfide oxidoreductase YuxK